MRSFLIVVGAILPFLGGVPAFAQSAQTQPLLSLNQITYLGFFTAPFANLSQIDGNQEYDLDGNKH